MADYLTHVAAFIMMTCPISPSFSLALLPPMMRPFKWGH